MSRRGWLLFCALAVIWGVPYLLIRLAVEHLSPAAVVCSRCAIGAVLLLPFALSRKALRPALVRMGWVALFAVIEIAMPFGMLSTAEKRLPSSLTGLLIAAVPLQAAVLGRWFGPRDPLDLRRWAGLLLGVTGVGALVVGAGNQADGGGHGGFLGLAGLGLSGWFAVGAVLLAAFGYAVGPLIISSRLADVPSIGVSTLALALTSACYAPFVLLGYGGRAGTELSGSGGGAVGPHHSSLVSWLAVLGLGVFCSSVAFLLMFALVAEVGPSRMTLITYVNPAVAVVLGVLVLDEPVTAGLLIGFPLILLGCWGATRPTQRRPGREMRQGRRRPLGGHGHQGGDAEGPVAACAGSDVLGGRSRH